MHLICSVFMILLSGSIYNEKSKGTFDQYDASSLTITLTLLFFAKTGAVMDLTTEKYTPVNFGGCLVN